MHIYFNYILFQNIGILYKQFCSYMYIRKLKSFKRLHYMILFQLFFMLRNNFDHLYDFCVCHEDALIYNITPTHQYILFCVTSWMVHWSLALGFHTDSIIIKKKTLMIGDCLRGDFLPWQENHMKFMLHL